MVLEYADGGNFYDYWINNGNYKSFNWYNKIRALNNIIKGLKEIHQKQMVHCDFHTGNILFTVLRKKTYISDMGLCREVSNMNKAKIYGVMPYVAPEVLRGNSYTQAADIYSFGMIMYITATGKQPFADRAHDEFLALDICKQVRPKVHEPEAPKCYIDLMKKCWDPNPDKRPDATEIHDQISSWNQHINNDIFKQAEEYRKANLPFFVVDQKINHPRAIYTSRILNSFTDDLLNYNDNNDNNNSECLDCVINN
jgi:serine/threonine protein kinase